LPDVASEEDARRDDPESLSEQRQRVRVLYRLLDQLGDKKREVIVLHDLEGMPAKEIATMVGAPVLTVRTRLFYARKELYAAMAAERLLESVLAALQKDRLGSAEHSGLAKETTTSETARESSP